MRAKYPEIELLLNEGAPRAGERLFVLISILVGEEKWRYPLIWGGIYFYKLPLPEVSILVADSILEHLINVSTKEIESPCVIDPFIKSVQFDKREYLDQLLIALTFLFLTADNILYKKSISSIVQPLTRDIALAHRVSLDGLPPIRYYWMLEHLITQNKDSFIELKNVLKILLSQVASSHLTKDELLTEDIIIMIQKMLDEVKSRLEKPDRNLLSMNNYSVISDYARAWFDNDKSSKDKRFPRHFFASDLRSQQLETINSFWITASTGLYFLREALIELSNSC